MSLLFEALERSKAKSCRVWIRESHPCKERKDGAPSVGMVHTNVAKGAPFAPAQAGPDEKEDASAICNGDSGNTSRCVELLRLARGYLYYEAARAKHMMRELGDIKVGDPESEALPILKRYGNYRKAPEDLAKFDKADYEYEAEIGPSGIYYFIDRGSTGVFCRMTRAVLNGLNPRLRRAIGLRRWSVDGRVGIKENSVTIVRGMVLAAGGPPLRSLQGWDFDRVEAATARLQAGGPPLRTLQGWDSDKLAAAKLCCRSLPQPIFDLRVQWGYAKSKSCSVRVPESHPCAERKGGPPSALQCSDSDKLAAAKLRYTPPPQPIFDLRVQWGYAKSKSCSVCVLNPTLAQTARVGHPASYAAGRFNSALGH